MNGRNTFLALAFLASAALAGPARAGITTRHFSTDADLLSAMLVKSVAEGRIGDRGGAATFELDLGNTTAAPVVQKQYNWVSGQAEPFTLTYDPVTNTLTFVLGGQTLGYNPAENLGYGLGIAEMAVRGRSTATSSVTLTDLVLNGTAVADNMSASAGSLDVLMLDGASFTGGFTLAGTATLNWTGGAPTQSNLAFQIKIGTVAHTTPASSGTWGLLRRLYR